MGYLHINNLAKDQRILQIFRRVYELEKVHGTSANVKLLREVIGGQTRVSIAYHSGGESYAGFVKLFDEASLRAAFDEHFPRAASLTFFGEAYGGAQQGMSKTYGTSKRFIVFDVQSQHDMTLEGTWLSVPNAADVTSKFGLVFTPYSEVDCTAEALDAARSQTSRVAAMNGIEGAYGEGIVVRPLVELTYANGERVIAKHKRPEFSERASKSDTKIEDPAKAQILAEAAAIADEWVTDERLRHVVDKLQANLGRLLTDKDTRAVINAMIEDVYREGAGLVVESKDATAAISRRTGKLFNAMTIVSISE